MQVTFDEETAAFGRNGDMRQLGIEVEQFGGETSLYAVTTRGMSYSAILRVPNEHIGQFVGAIGAAIRDNAEGDVKMTEFDRWRDGKRAENDFIGLVFKAFSIADSSNRARLVAAFPEQFLL